MPESNPIKRNRSETYAVALTLLFVIAAISAAGGGNNVLWFLPAAIGIAVLALFSVRRLLMLTVFMVPLSIQLSYFVPEIPFDISLPTEPVLALILLLVLFRLIVTREFDISLLRHPMTIIIAVYLCWTIVTAITSEMPLVSFKALFYRMWFTASFYLLSAQIFLKGDRGGSYILAYSAGFAIVVLYFFFRVGGEGLLNQKFAHSACYPFFKDHTSFGAAQAFCIPPLLVMFFDRSRSRLSRWISFFFFALFTAALIFSYSRAAWVSLIVSLAIGVVLVMRIPRGALITLAFAGITALAVSAGAIWQKMDNTTEDSSTDLRTHLRSSSNISTDQSNLERINRWKSAWRMFEERPVTGWGPGTYQFQYAPFQYSGDKTEISTNDGDAGNSHSEYLGALSESGIPGALLFILIAVVSVLAGIRALDRATDRYSVFFIAAVVAGLMTYVIHGVMNSFLDTDKIAALFWGFIAMITAADIKSREDYSVSDSPDTDGKN